MTEKLQIPSSATDLRDAAFGNKPNFITSSQYLWNEVCLPNSIS